MLLCIRQAPGRNTVLASAAALVLAAPAGAHVEAIPNSLPANGSGTFTLTVHNDVARVMTGFIVTVPPSLAIAEAGEVDGWSSSVEGRVASWNGGDLAFETAEDFTLTLEAPSEPQPVTLEAEQRYPGDGALRWPVELTVVPGDEASSAGYVWVVVALGAGLALVGLAVLWRRRSSLQEK